MKKFNNLCPFKWFVLENFPFIEADFDAINNYQLLCKVVEYLNKTIDKTNELGSQVEILVNWFNNLDVQDEVDKKLDEMVEDGTLAEIINQEIFNELNNKIELLQKTKTKSNIYLGSFFDGTTEKINFCVSNDGINFSDILPNIDISGRDPNILYNPANKTFYLSVTTSGDSWDFICYTSQDLINWNRHYVSLGILTGIRWAPELFFDKNGDLWATITAGSDDNNLSLFKAKCNNIELLTFDTRTPINLTQQNIIDGNIIYDNENDLYYLTCKNNTTSLQLIYSSSDLENWNIVNSDVLKTGEPCEGGFMIKTNKKFTFYGDTWQSFNYYIMAQSENPANFTAFKRPNSLMNKRHGFICFIENQEAVSLITNLNSYKQMENINRNVSREYLLSGNIDTLIVYPKFIYRITANTTINKLINAYNLETMPFYFAGARGLTLTINNIINSEFETKTINKTINNSTYNNEKLNFISLIGNPVIEENANIITYLASNITVSEGWTVSIYNFKRYKDYIHINGDLKKTSSASSNIAFTINNANLRPQYDNFTLSNRGKMCWLKPNGEFHVPQASIDETNYISLDYLCL